MEVLFILFLSVTIIRNSHAVVCSKPWTFSRENSCYYLGINPALTWGEARIQCMEDGGHLVMFETKEEEAFIGTYLHQHHFDFPYYIGAIDVGQEGNWYWDHNGRGLTYTNWNVHEPQGKYYENCVLKFGINHNYKWIDINCSQLAAYLCEKD